MFIVKSTVNKEIQLLVEQQIISSTALAKEIPCHSARMKTKKLSRGDSKQRTAIANTNVIVGQVTNSLVKIKHELNMHTRSER